MSTVLPDALRSGEYPSSNFEDEPLDLRYDLSEEEFNDLTQLLISQVAAKEVIPENGIITAVVPPTSPYANLVRTLEYDAHFYSNPEVAAAYETNSFFMLVLDYNAKSTDGEVKQALAHVYRVVTADNRNQGYTGIETIDDLIATEQITLDEVANYYNLPDLSRCWSVGSNIDVGSLRPAQGAKPSLEKPYGALGYKAIFEISNAQKIDYLFCYLNQSAVKSLSRLDIEFDPLCGRTDLLMPTGLPEEGSFDTDYQPVAIPVQANAEVFQKIDTTKSRIGQLIAATSIKVIEVPPESVF